MPPLSILAVRFLLAFLILAVIFHKRMKRELAASLRGGIILGVLYTVCMVFEMYALRQIDTGVCSLIENMAIVLVPLYAAVLTRSIPKKKTMLCAVLAVAGVGFLSLSQSQTGGGGTGILLSVLAAITYGVCIMATETVSREGDPAVTGILQLGVMGVLSLIASLITGTFSVPETGEQWAMLMMLVLVCSCFGFALQPVGQKYVPAETAAVFTVVNPLTTSVMGIWIAGERLTGAKSAGYILILVSLFLYNYRGKKMRSPQAVS